jgi:hypothetical protein
MTCLLNWIGEQATASATADPCGMTNKRTDKSKDNGRRQTQKDSHYTDRSKQEDF